MTHPAITRRALVAGTAGMLAAASLPRMAHAMPAVEEVADASVPVLGNAGGDVTIVEVVDYQCGYCKLCYAEISRLMDEDTGVRLVVKDWPVFGPASEFAARALLACRDEPSIYSAGVAALMANERRLSERLVTSLLVDSGVNAASLAERMVTQKSEIDAILIRNATHAAQFGLKGTPAVLVGSRLFRRAMPIEDLRAAVAVARQAPDSAI
jgi:protein-disulfide isomerase